MIKSDFHVHTLFSDGSDTPETIVKAAIKLGLGEIGFSDHAFVSFDDCRIEKEDRKRYIDEIARLKEKYAGSIGVLCGIEMDYFSEDDVSDYDYVIGSVHYLKVNGKIYGVDHSPEMTRLCIDEAFKGDTAAFAEAYYEQVSKIRETTGADIVGHFDVITKFEKRGINLDTGERYARAAKTALDSLLPHCAFEISTGAMTRGYRDTPYPSDEILAYIRENGGRVVVSSDAHASENIAGKFEVAEKKLSDFGFSACGFTDKNGVYHSQL